MEDWFDVLYCDDHVVFVHIFSIQWELRNGYAIIVPVPRKHQRFSCHRLVFSNGIFAQMPTNGLENDVALTLLAPTLFTNHLFKSTMVLAIVFWLALALTTPTTATGGSIPPDFGARLGTNGTYQVSGSDGRYTLVFTKPGGDEITLENMQLRATENVLICATSNALAMWKTCNSSYLASSRPVVLARTNSPPPRLCSLLAAHRPP